MKTLSAQERLQQEPEVICSPEAQAFLSLIETGDIDNVRCWRAAEVQRRDGSSIEGRGLFALDDIPANTLIAIKQGHIVSSATVKDNAEVINGSQQQIGPNEFLAGLTEEEVDASLVGYNHACDPNARVMLFRGVAQAFLVTRKPVEAGEEITADYSTSQMTNTHLMKFCQCGSPECRGFVAPLWDWEDEALQQKYAGEFAWFIEDAIDEQKQRPTAELLARREVHETLKYAGMTVLADGEVERLEAQKQTALAQINGTLLRSIVGRYYDRRPAGQELQFAKAIRLKAAAYFASICKLGNIDEIGIDRGEIMTAIVADSKLEDIAETLRHTSLEPHLDEVIKFAEQLDRLFNV